MAEFFDPGRRGTAMTLEQYRALDNAGKITRPLTLGDTIRVPSRGTEPLAPSPDDVLGTRLGDIVADIVALRARADYVPPRFEDRPNRRVRR